MPDTWKKTYVCPVFKKSGVDNITNYRPVSLLCNVSKIIETLFYQQLYDCVRGSITLHQCGFRHRRSTTTNLICFSQYAPKVSDSILKVDVICTEFKKLFDQLELDHYIFWEKWCGTVFHHRLQVCFNLICINIESTFLNRKLLPPKYLRDPILVLCYFCFILMILWSKWLWKPTFRRWFETGCPGGY